MHSIRSLVFVGGTCIFAIPATLAACGASEEDSGGGSSGRRGATGPGGGPSSPGASDDGPGAIDPGPPAVQLVGRFDERDPSGARAAWPGARIVARFEGTEVKVRLREEAFAWMDGAPSEWDVSVDGSAKTKIVTTAGAKAEHAIATGLPAGPHVVELYKRSDAQNGVTQFLGFDFGSGKLLSPPARKQRRIEIVGDSAASGYGIEGVGQGPDCPGPDYAARWQNFRKSFGARLGEALSAEVAGTVHGGKGIARNIWTEDKETMPVIFERAIPGDASSTWDFSRFRADVVVVMLGGNDFDVGQPVDDGPVTSTQFADAYDAFARTLRSRYPSAHVFLTVSPSINDVSPAGRNTRTNVATGVKTVATRRGAAGDAKVYAFEPAPASGGELTACNGHGNLSFHERLAKELAAQIKSKTGW